MKRSTIFLSLSLVFGLAYARESAHAHGDAQAHEDTAAQQAHTGHATYSAHQQHEMRQQAPPQQHEGRQDEEARQNETDQQHAHHEPSSAAATGQARTPIPPVTEAERDAAFAPLHAHAMDGNAIHGFSLVDRLELRDNDDGHAVAWDAQGWIGTDTDRLRWRTEGERIGGRTEHGDVELLYSRMVSPWWDVVGGARHDFAPGGAQDFVALGVLGLAPQKFEVSATLYFGEAGQAAARAEVEYELPLSSRWVLQPRLEANAYGRGDARRGIGSGLNDIEAGLRLRCEIRREFAPYVGLERAWRFGGAARFMRAQGEAADDWRWVAGVRVWF